MTTDPSTIDTTERDERESRLDDLRRLILRKMREHRFTLADLSRAAGKNEAYFHQFIWRPKPKGLPEDVREAIAPLLTMHPDELRGHARPTMPAVLRRAPEADAIRPMPATSETGSARDIPVYQDTAERIEPSSAQEWTYRPPSLLTAGPAFAVWISAPRGRLRVGDLAFLRPNQPPRLGDTVMALDNDKRMVAMGDLAEVTATHILIEEQKGAPKKKIKIGDTRIIKVAAVVLA